VIGLSQIGYITSPQLISTVGGLGEIGYASTTINFTSTVTGLGSIGYISTATLNKKFDTLGNWYVSSLSMASTVDGLSSFGYVTNINLSSAIGSISTMKNNIRFDTVTNVTVIGGTNTFTNTANIIYVSTFYQSSIIYSGARPGLQIQGNMVTDNDMEFSTATIRLDAFSNFTNSNSRITIEAYPTLLFTKLGTACTSPICLPISTLLKYGNNTLLYNTTTTNYLFAANGLATIGSIGTNNNSNINSSNAFQQPIRISVPQNTVLNYESNYSLYHYMPNSINNAQFQQGLHSNQFTPYFGSTGSIFVSVQNSV
jgi:hypothetical protein